MFSKSNANLAAVVLLASLALGAVTERVAAQGAGGAGGAVPVVLEGELDVVHGDDFVRGRSDTFYFLRDLVGDRVFELAFERAPTAALTSGQRVTVRGRALGRRIEVSELVVGLGAEGETTAPADAGAPPLAERNAVVLMVDLLDAKASSRYTLEQIEQNMFTGARSVDGVFHAGSYGQLAFPNDTDLDSFSDVFGPFTINYTADVCDYYGWASAADAAAQSTGIDLSLYQHRVYVLPRYNEIACSWAGLANVGCGTYCRAWIAEGESPMVYAHELGHNLNLAHAGTDPENDGVMNAEYGDYSDPMGLSRAWHLFNAPHTDQKGWFGAFPGSIATVVASGTYDIAPMTDDPSLATAPLALRIEKPDSGDYYYLSYRQPVGYDDSLSATYTQGLNIHRYRGAGYNYTTFIDSLVDFESFEDPANGLTITQLGHDPDGVSIDIAFGCAARTPTVSLAPVSLAAQPGPALVYSVTVTNEDFSGCDPTDFTLVPDSGLLLSTLSPALVTLAPGASQAATLTVETAGAADGNYALTVEAIDSDGLEPAHDTNGLGSGTAVVDGTAPSTPTNLAYSIKRKSWAQLSWSAVSDLGSGVDHYRIYRDGLEIGSSTTTAYTDKNYTAGVIYTVDAVDQAGNASPESAPATESGGGKGGGKGGGGNGGGKGSGNK